jgi:DNA primase
MPIDLELIRDRNPIEGVIGEKFTLRKSSSRYVGIEHDSLAVIPASGVYFWNSRDEHGDVFDFVGRHVLTLGIWNSRDAAQFMETLRYLARRAGIMLEEGTIQHTPSWAERQLVQRLHETLLETPAALDYVMKTRGWQLATVKAARLGFMPRDKRALLADLHLSDSLRAVVQKFPSGMIVYPHLDSGRLRYLSGRSTESKQHYNPPRDLIGERQPYANHLYSQSAEQVVLVEGQADAVTFAEWGIAALALGGMQLSEALLARLRTHPRIFVALDNTPDANV